MPTKIKSPINAKQIENNSNFQFNRFNLSFSHADACLEKPFLEAYFSKNLIHLRLCHFYTIFFYGLAGLIDYFLFPQNLNILFSIRFLVVVPIFIIGFFFSFTSHYKSSWQHISFFYILLTGGSFIIFTAIAQPPEAYDYYAGLFFCMMFGYTFIRERFIYASIAGLILILIYLFISSAVIQMPRHILIQSNFYLFLANLLGMLIARHLEFTARRDFFLEYKLSEEQENVLELNNQLEKRVLERTDELQKAYIQLNQEISERKKIEKKLFQAHKMEAIGTLAGGIAHDFNNILFPIIGYTEMLMDDLSDKSPLKKNLDQIYSASMRAKNLVRQILTFSRQGSSELQFISLQQIIKEVLKLIRSSIPTTIEIKHNISSDCPAVKADPTQIHQIIMNLTTNAYHAMEETSGEMRVSLETAELQSSEIVDSDMSPGIYACLTVADTGTGIPADIKDKIFDPFFTTKKDGKGTGMGLSVVHGIVKNIGGTVQVQSEPGNGTEFRVYLPAAGGSSEKQKPCKKETLEGGIENILLVDDDKAILKMEKQMLEGLGYQVTPCASGVEALEVFSRADQFDIVITDMAMPNLPGDRLSAELKKKNPDIPVLLCTGFSEIMSEEKALSMNIDGFLMKPIVMADLSKKIRSLLEERKK